MTHIERKSKQLDLSHDLARIRGIVNREWWQRTGEDQLDGMLIAIRLMNVLELVESLRSALMAECEAFRNWTMRASEIDADGDEEADAEVEAEAYNAASVMVARAVEALSSALVSDGADDTADELLTDPDDINDTDASQ